MTQIINGLHVLTYDEWVKIPEIANGLEELEDCLTCDGEGEHECECGDSHTCGECFGSGKSEGEDLSAEYSRALRDELKKLVEWREGLKTKSPSAYNSEDASPDHVPGAIIKLEIQKESTQ